MPNVIAPTAEEIAQAGASLRSGSLVAFPTETVYGLGADAFNAQAVAKIFAAKQRPHFDPLIVHIADVDELSNVASVDDRVERLIEAFWPGPLTIVMNKSEELPSIVTSGLSTVGVRMPSNRIASDLIKAAGVAIAAPSANPFGFLSPTRAQHVVDGLGDAVDLVIDGGATEWGVESTIVALADEGISILRLGAVSVEQLERVVAKVGFATSVVDTQAATAPGQLAQHYSPNTRLRLINEGESAPDGGGYLAFRNAPTGSYAAVEVLSPDGNAIEAAANLFELLHKLDASGCEQITAELVPEEGIGRAINDRLRRASAKF